MEDGAAEDEGSDGVEPILEGRHDAEVAASAPQAPEEPGFLGGTGASATHADTLAQWSRAVVEAIAPAGH